MEGEIKQFPPSELKLERLRRAGIVPYSEELMYVAAFLGALLAVWWLAGPFESGLSRFAVRGFSLRADGLLDGSAGTAAASGGAGVARLYAMTAQAGSLLFMGAAGVLLAILVPALLLGVLQTRFLFNTSAVRFDFSRVFGFRLNPFGGAIGRMRRAVSLSVLLGAWFLVALLSLRGAYSGINELMLAPADKTVGTGSQPQEKGAPVRKSTDSSQQLTDVNHVNHVDHVSRGLSLLRARARGIWWTGLFFAFFVGALSRFLAVLRFRREHGMSRSELEAELRESEPAPQYKEALADFYEEDTAAGQ